MKTIALSLLAGFALTGSGWAGTEVSHKDFKQAPPVMTPCFKDIETQFDVYGAYNDANKKSRYSDGWGGGVAVNYFFARYFGVGVDGNVYDGNANGVWDTSARLIARYPIEGGGFCWAPYIFGGGGLQEDHTSSGTWHGGGGLEWRATPAFGLFAEGRYTWTAQSDNSAQARMGVRFAF